jgi:hypothetical protein
VKAATVPSSFDGDWSLSEMAVSKRQLKMQERGHVELPELGGAAQHALREVLRPTDRESVSVASRGPRC